MAPGKLLDDTSSNNNDNNAVSGSHLKPTVYLIDDYHPAAVEKAQKLFDLVLPTDPRCQTWQEHAEYLLVKSSSLTSSDIATAPKLRAIGKQGVGVDKIDTQACAARAIPILNTPGVNATAVAELVLALTMAVAREIGSIQVRQSQGQAIPKQTCSGLLLTSRTLV